MDLLPLALIQSTNLTRSAARSALPDAPVVPSPQPRARAFRTRVVTAQVLHRAAAAVAPKPSCSPAH